MSESVQTEIGVAMIELLLGMLAGADMARRLVVCEAVLMAACELGAAPETCGALLEAINGSESARIRQLAAEVLRPLRAPPQLEARSVPRPAPHDAPEPDAIR